MDSSSSFVYDARTRTFLQHDFARQILQRLRSVEKSKLDSINVPSSLFIPDNAKVHPEMKLTALVDLALRERSPAMGYLQAVMEVLSEQTQYAPWTNSCYSYRLMNYLDTQFFWLLMTSKLYTSVQLIEILTSGKSTLSIFLYLV